MKYMVMFVSFRLCVFTQAHLIHYKIKYMCV